MNDKAPAVVLALSCHPDDIEFMMAGTLLMLGKAGFELHVMNSNYALRSARLSSYPPTERWKRRLLRGRK